jgi:single-stranded-DNA-specific exonuclease
MEKRWVIRKQSESAEIRELSEKLNIDQHLANLLIQRGIHTLDEARDFFRPALENLHDPFLMTDMDKAVERIGSALQNREKIMVYGDYDVDGTTAVALVFTFLRRFHDAIDYYIPDRYTEGYGISLQGIDFAADQGFTLIVALDCGVKAVEKIQYAKTRGIDFIVCDHHRPGNQLPPAYALLDPKRADCSYPYKELSGCGIGFKLVQALAMKQNIPFEELHQYLDLVVVSIASDIVDITGENRILAHYGLRLLNSSPRPGLEAILTVSKIEKSTKTNGNLLFSKELTISDLVFLIGPRINAAGRIESGKNSVKLLICEDKDEAMALGEQINNFNTERKNLDMVATQQAIERISNDDRLLKAKSTVIYNPAWHKGVIGIVASRLTEHFYRPTVVLTFSGELITGSARSVKDFDIYDAIDSCSDLLEHFGGHKYAAGLSLKPENLIPFTERFETVVADKLEGKSLVPEIEIDSCIPLSAIHSRFFNVLKQFSPFGPGNMSPLFRTDGIVDAGGSRVVGKNHLKLYVVHPEISGGPFSAIAFQQGNHFEKIEKGIPFNICYHVEENEWNGVTSLQLNIRDIKFGD